MDETYVCEKVGRGKTHYDIFPTGRILLCSEDCPYQNQTVLKWEGDEIRVCKSEGIVKKVLPKVVGE